MELTPEMLLKNRYRIERKLGQGGMGAVYLAFDTALDTQVALKSNRSPAANSTAQFLREARMLASLHHPGLPRVTDYFVVEDMQYLVMDYIAGQDLDTLLTEKGAQPIQQVMAWASQLGEAVSFLHHQKPAIIHRDIKPANVRLNEEGQVILVDFGIAKEIADTTQATSTGASSYTPGYAPPEQYGGTIRTGTYTDQYSLAALLYHLLSGEKPADSIQRAMGNAQLTPLNELLPGAPANLQAALEKALSIRPSDRFAHVDDFLRAVLPPAAAPAAKPRPAEATVIERPAQQQTVWVPPAAPAPAAAASASDFLPPPPYQPPAYQPPAQPAAQSPRRKISLLLIGLLVFACIAVAGLAAAGYFFLPKILKQTQPAAPVVSALLSDTPRPSATVPATPTISPSLPLPPSETPLPALPAATTQPSETPVPSETPIPSATPLSIGGGGLLAFSSNRGDGATYQLWTMHVYMNDQGQVAGGDFTQLTDGPGDKRQPNWSPDGKQIAYSAPGEKGKNIFVINADGSGEPAPITNLRGDESEPAWSPDGNWIAFTSDAREDKVLMLYLVRPDGSGLIKLSSFQYESSPTWSPSMQLGFVMNLAGNNVLYFRGQKDPKSGATPTQPYYVTPSFFDKLELTGNLGQVAQPAWSPDGAWVAYTRMRSSRNQIYLAHYPVRQPVEKDILQLTDSNSDTTPAWSPDGQWIVFTSQRDGNSEVYIMRTTGKNQNNLTLNAAEDLDPAWMILYQ